jgi:hypothetical protein
MTWRLTLCVSLFAAGIGWLQVSPPQTRDPAAVRPATGPGSISGVVVTDETPPQPVARARVTLTRIDGVLVQPVSTDDRGRFSFASLSIGSYIVEARRASLVAPAFTSAGARVPLTSVVLSDAQPGVSITLKLAKAGVITGTVRDQNGEPLQGVDVMTSDVRAGAVAPAGQRQTAVTDNLGRYRLASLPAGVYVVSAALPNVPVPNATALLALSRGDVQGAIQEARSGAPTVLEPDRVQAGRPSAWVRVYYPGTPARAGASPIAIAAGEERAGIDLTMQLVPTSRIDGIVTLPSAAPASGVRITVAPAGESSLAVTDADRTARTDADGRYAISGLVPGKYELLALNTAASPSAGQVVVQAVRRSETPTDDPPLWAKAETAVDGQDITVPLSLTTGVRVSGHLVFEGTEPPVLEVARQRVTIRHTESRVVPPMIQVEPTGKFELSGVIPGKYDVIHAGVTTARTWYLKAAAADGVDVLATPMEVRPGHDIRALVLTLTDRLSRLRATLVGAGPTILPRYTVVAFPTDRGSWAIASRVRQLQLRADGVFITTNLPAGEYFVAAILDMERDAVNEGALERASLTAVKVSIANRQDVTCELKVGG